MAAEPGEKPRDRWARAEVIFAGLSGVLLPVVVAAVGGLYTFVQDQHNAQDLVQQKAIEQITARARQATDLLTHLSSANDRERLLAIKVAEQLGKENLLPQELVPVLLEIARSDPSSPVSVAASSAVAGTTKVTAVASSGQVVTAASQGAAALATLPPRVYVHIRSEEQRPAARTLSAAIEQAGFSVPGIQRVDVGPAHSELRYFRGSDPQDVEGISKALAAAGVTVQPADLSAGFRGANIRARHYELWLAPDYASRAGDRRARQ
jgi:hypothetical protein